MVPVINILLEAGCSGGLFNQTQSPEVVVMAPTRELAIQIHKEAMKFSHNSVLKTVLIYGGTNVQHQVTKVQTGCNILVSTPGRLKDLVERTYIDFSSVKCFILDEADRMLDLGFGKDIEAVVKHPTMPPTVIDCALNKISSNELHNKPDVMISGQKADADVLGHIPRRRAEIGLELPG